MSDRTINFGESETEATYQIQDTDGAAGGGNFVIAKDTNANTVLLQYNPSTDAFEYAADVDLSANAVTADDLTATTASVSTAPSASDDVARKSEVDAKADTPHALGGADHSSDTLANLNGTVSDATLDDASSSRPPESHASTHESGGGDAIDSGSLDATSAFQTFTTTTDPSASVGEIWYRSDLD